MRFSRYLALAIGLALFTITVSLSAQTTTNPKWQANDIFLTGTTAGQWQVFRPSLNAFIDSVSDGISGAGPNHASAIDATWHLVGTDSGGSGWNIIKFRVSPHDQDNPTLNAPLTQVVSTLSNASAVSSIDPRALVIDGAGNLIVANASPATIAKISPAGQAVGSSPPWPIQLSKKNLDGTLSGLDIDSGEQALYYTSSGNTVRRVQLVATTNVKAGTITSLKSVSQATLYAIRFIPHAWFPSGATACGGVACPTGDGLLVAGGGSIVLLDTAGNLIHRYTIPNASDLEVVTLDPMTKMQGGAVAQFTGFWAASPTSSHFYRVQFSSNGTSGIQQYDASGVGFTGVLSIATYPGFSANQAAPTVYSSQQLLCCATDSTGQIIPYESTDAVYKFTNSGVTDTLTLTAYANPSFNTPPYVITTPTVYASAIQQSADGSDDGFNCLPTLGSGFCTIWQVDLNPALPSNALAALKMATSNTASGQTTDAATRMYRNNWDDITDKIETGGWSRSSVYTLIEPTVATTGTGPGGADCIYYQPVNNGYPTTNSGGTLNNPGNVTFKFTCFGIPATSTDPNALAMNNLVPRISVVEVTPGGGALPYFPVFTSLTGGTCCTQDLYRYDATANTWVINVSFSNLPSNNVSFIATTYDARHFISAFDMPFTILNGANNIK